MQCTKQRQRVTFAALSFRLAYPSSADDHVEAGLGHLRQNVTVFACNSRPGARDAGVDCPNLKIHRCVARVVRDDDSGFRRSHVERILRRTTEVDG